MHLTMTMHFLRDTLRRMLPLVRKELMGLLHTPVAYLVTVLFLGISEYLYFKNVFLVGEASLASYFGILPWLLLVVVPALTMGIFSQECETGTYETLATQPLSELVSVLGKFVAHLLFLAGVLLTAVFPMAFTFSFFANIDWGTVVAGYLAAVGVSGIYIAIGLAISALFTKQVSSFLLTVAVLFFLVMAGTDLVAGSVPVLLTVLFERVSVMTHYNALMRGAIDMRDAWYVASVIVAFLALAYYRLIALRCGPRHTVRARTRLGVALLVVTVLLSNAIGSALPGRIDLTRYSTYTLSDATKKILGELPDMVQITLYTSSALPAQLQPTIRDVRDTLKDYERYGRGDVSVAVRDPGASAELEKEAGEYGIQAVQFNVMGQSELSVKRGYLGVVVAYGGEHRSIPFVESTSDLEYQLTSMIRELTATDKKTVAFLSGSGERARFGEYGTLSRELEKLYEVKDVLFTEGEQMPEGATSTDVLVVADPSEPFGTTTRAFLNEYIARGGALLALVQGVRVEPRSLSALLSAGTLPEILRTYGVEVAPELAYDLRSHETVQAGGGGGVVYLLPYPFWMRSFAVPGSPITQGLESVLLPWAGPLDVNAETMRARNATATPLIVTTPFAGRMGEPFDISPETRPSTTNLSEQIMALAVQSEQATGTRMVVVGSVEFVADDLLRNNPANLGFALSAIEWLAQDESIASIKMKSGQRPAFAFESAQQQSLVAYGNMAFVVLVPIILGLVLYLRRRKITQKTYTEYPPYE